MKAIVIGAGPAGLAAAACLKQAGADVVLFEKADRAGSSWHGHYDGLRLHTARGRSSLPGLAFPASVGRYPSRSELIAYLGDYCRHHDLKPRFGTTVKRVSRAGTLWHADTDKGAETADIVVFATGFTGAPNRPVWPGSEGFPGQMLHSSEFRNAEPFRGQRVLVVGFGNSGGDIALELSEAAAKVDMSVRGPVNLLPKELFGIPITSFGILSKILPYRLADAVNAPILRMKLGRTESYGLQKAGKGPLAQIIEDGRIPLIDVGTLGAIKAGKITVQRGIESFNGATVRFSGGAQADYDAVVLATGYRVDLRPMLPGVNGVLDSSGRPLVSGGATAAKGLYFCSYRASAGGQLFQMSREAEAIAELATGR